MVAILSPDALPEVRMTVDEYLQADLPEGFRYELVDGVVEMAPTPGGDHDGPVGYLTEEFVICKRAHEGEIAHLSQRAGIVIPDKVRVREPDLVLYRKWEGKGRGYAVWKEFMPFLVVEVISPGQEQRDFVDKRKDYWLAGIEEYWIVDPRNETLTVLSRGAKEWEEAIYDRPDQSYVTPRLTDLEIRVGALFGR